MSSKKNIYINKFREIIINALQLKNEYNDTLIDSDIIKLVEYTKNNNLSFIFKNCQISIFNYKYENTDSILIVFPIPVNNKEDKTSFNIKQFNIKLIDIIKFLEKSLIYLDYIHVTEQPINNFIFLTIVKKINIDVKREIIKEKG